MAPRTLRVEGLIDPLGLDVDRPMLSWTIGTADSQQAYEIQTRIGDVDWSSGPVSSSERTLIEYPGPVPLGNQRVDWRVRIRGEGGASPWSEWAHWEASLDRSDWVAEWIAPVEIDRAPAGSRPTHLMRTEFDAPPGIARARLHITAHGLYEAHLNGERIGDIELTPGYTEYRDRLQVQVYDVTEQLRVGGPNALVVELSDGWYRGKVSIFRFSEQWGETTAVLAQLVIETEDGASTLVVSDSSWRSTPTGHLADIIDGETIDLREAVPRDMGPGYDVSAWNAVEVESHELTNLVGSSAPPVRRKEDVIPIAIVRLDAHRQIVDLGQNIAGWLRIRNLGARGNRVTLTFGEVLDLAGDVTQVNLAPALPFMPEPLAAGQIDHLISDGDPSTTAETRHSSHGFRFVRVEGLDHDLAREDVTAVVVHTDLRRTGWFECSDESLNLLHEAAVRSFRGNAIDIPTDCPVRERAGFTGDWQIFFPAAAYLYDVSGFSTKWLRDLAVGQRDDGIIGNVAPAPRSEREHPIAGGMNGSAGWGDAAVIVPWEQYVTSGDERVLAESWPMMVRWIQRVRSSAATQRHPSRIARHAEPAPHERYLWDSDFHWGEWLAPDGKELDFGAFMASDKSIVSTAYFRRSTQLMSRIATVLGQRTVAAEYAELSERIRRAWCLEFLDDRGNVTSDSQADCVRALAFDLVPPESRDRVGSQLADLVRANGNHLSTGFLATGMLLPTLADAGHADLAFAVLQQRTAPSWLDMIDRGATTMWEHWEGFTPDGLPFESHNHFSKGAVITFLHRYVAGIRPLLEAPGYRSFEVVPHVGGGVTSATGRFECRFGLIESIWSIADGVFRIRVTVPAGTTCRLVMPSGLTHGLMQGTHQFAEHIVS